MMNSQEALSLYEEISVITDQMLTAARIGDWELMVRLENACADRVAAIKDGERELAKGEVRERKIKIIQKILSDDREIRSITEPWMARLAMQINSVGARRKLGQAYGVSHIG